MRATGSVKNVAMIVSVTLSHNGNAKAVERP